MNESIGEILECENKKSSEEYAKQRIISAKLEARRDYEKYMNLKEHDKALFFLARMSAFDECLRYL